ncbi:TerC family protein [Govanella unica]|uniref:TerC family protein n=1 Tax=Govanella unica TaxID=2975056 RepID=A0A9X3TWU9_9PROT|nr:TerC family protein [Govania unica]MDA5193416.1 TerC family protein [Govania unica]
MFEWIYDPTLLAGFFALIALELVLGIDNLVFIAILAGKLPVHLRDRARVIGLLLALLMRLALLASLSWIVSLTHPLFTAFHIDFSGRDVILTVGGLFLLFKGTSELHERLEGSLKDRRGPRGTAAFWPVVAQIVVLDAIFSLDAVITAVGMVTHLEVMMLAVIVAIGIMLLASKPLTVFIIRHPTVIILCLAFLLMIGFSLVVEGFGFYIPKGYLYAAIGFAVLIEAFNQIARRNKRRHMTAKRDLRERTADTVLRLLGGKAGRDDEQQDDVMSLANAASDAPVFAPVEREMIEGVLELAERPVRSLMTPRREVDWLDADASLDEIRARILASGHTRYPIARGDLGNLIGVAQAKDIYGPLLGDGVLDLVAIAREPLVVHESAKALRVLEMLRNSPIHLAIVVDEHGSVEGVVSPTDILSAVAGELVEEGEEASRADELPDGSWMMDGDMDIRRVSRMLDTDLDPHEEDYTTLAGFIIWELGHLATAGESLTRHGYKFTVAEADGHKITRVKIERETPLFDDPGI